MHKLFGLGLSLLVFAAVPSSSNYTLKSYDIGSGGTSSSSSSNYRLNGISGEQSGKAQTSATKGVVSGVNTTSNANEPAAPSFTNPSNYYDRLQIVLNPSSNDPSDTKYLIAISSDNFTTTNYVQTDHSVSSSQAIANYQTYVNWGGSSGFLVLGLSPATTYQIKVKALQGSFSGSAYGPSASAATVQTSVSMGLTTTLNTTPPFTVTFSSLTPGSVVNGDANALIALTSNANNGGTVYLRSSNAGLLSTLTGNTIASTTANLTAATNGYGAQVTAVSQTSGGPLVSQSPFNGSLNTVGGLTTSLQPILSTVGPITGASGTVRLLAKASSTDPSAADYSDSLSFVAAMNF